jgi:hypothetical protein
MPDGLADLSSKPIPVMETPLTMPVTAVNLRRRFLRACELKQAVNWEKIVDCLQRCAKGSKIEVSAIVRIEGIEQLKETASKAWEAMKTSNERPWGSPMIEIYVARSKETWKASEGTAARHARTAASLWTTGDARQEMIRRLMHSHTNANHLGPSAELNLVWMSSITTACGNSTEFLEKWHPLLEAFEAGAYCFFITNHCMAVCTLPTVVSTDDQGELHSASGPAFVWLNDIRDYYWHGVYVESYVVEQPERITLADLEKEISPKARRVKIERFSQVRSGLNPPPISSVTTEELKERYKRACGLKQTVNWGKIVECFQQWAAAMKIEASAIVRIENAEQLKAAAILNPSMVSGSPASLRVPHGSRASSVARDTNTALEAGLEWGVNATRPAHDASQLWLARMYRAMGKPWCQWNPTFMCLSAIGALELGIETEFLIWYPLFEAFEAGAFFFNITDRGIEVCTPPSVFSLDDRRRLHSASGPAFVWLNDIRDYYWHGVYVESYVVEKPESITVLDIETETNMEVRRVKIERFGQARYLLDSRAILIHRDGYGALYRKLVPGDEPLVMVKVLNATPEPDGSFKDYFLRVPPTMRTAKEAVAWTFGKSPDNYEPEQET